MPPQPTLPMSQQGNLIEENKSKQPSAKTDRHFTPCSMTIWGTITCVLRCINEQCIDYVIC